jgi:hypothetical protein
MKSRKISSTNSGSILVEFSIAIAIFAITLTALATLIFSQQISSTNMTNYRKATFLALSNLEKARTILSDSEYESTTTSSVYMTPCVKRITSSALWNSSGKEKTVTFSILQANTDRAINLSGDCEGFTDTHFILSTTSPFTQSSTPLAGTGRALDILNDRAYIDQTIGTTSTLTIYDTLSQTPTFLSTITLPLPIVKIAATQKQIYLALNGTHDQFEIINTDDVSHPKVLASRTLPTVAGEYPGATSIAYYNKKVYIGTHRTAGREFHIYDVSTPDPTWLGSIELNHNINSIAIREPYAFLATSGNTKDLIVLDISNPKSIKQISSLNVGGNEDAISIFLIGDRLYLGRKESLRPQEHDVFIISIADPQKPFVVHSAALQKDIVGIRTYGDYTFTANSNYPYSLNIFTSNTLQPIQVLPIPDTIKDFDFENKNAYILTDKSFIRQTYFQ